MSVFLTPKGKILLGQKIKTVEEKLKVVMSQKGDAYENGGNGWHDNFAFEQIVREEAMHAGELMSLNEILKNSTVVNVENIDISEVNIGCIITLEDEELNPTDYEVVGYGETDTTCSPKKLEYLAPIINPFMGSAVGDEYTVRIGGKKVTLALTNIRRR